jgi:hypothetical protein
MIYSAERVLSSLLHSNFKGQSEILWNFPGLSSIQHDTIELFLLLVRIILGPIDTKKPLKNPVNCNPNRVVPDFKEPTVRLQGRSTTALFAPNSANSSPRADIPSIKIHCMTLTTALCGPLHHRT